MADPVERWTEAEAHRKRLQSIADAEARQITEGRYRALEALRVEAKTGIRRAQADLGALGAGSDPSRLRAASYGQTTALQLGMTAAQAERARLSSAYAQMMAEAAARRGKYMQSAEQSVASLYGIELDRATLEAMRAAQEEAATIASVTGFTAPTAGALSSIVGLFGGDG